jgi:hypothetical protein
MTGAARTVVNRTKDAALEHVRKALRTDGSLLTRPEIGFVRTSCHILGLNGEGQMRHITKKARDQGGQHPRRVLDCLQSQLAELADRVERQEAHPKPRLQHAGSGRHGGAGAQPGAPAKLRRRTEGCYGRRVFNRDQGSQNSNRKREVRLLGYHRPGIRSEPVEKGGD